MAALLFVCGCAFSWVLGAGQLAQACSGARARRARFGDGGATSRKAARDAASRAERASGDDARAARIRARLPFARHACKRVAISYGGRQASLLLLIVCCEATF